MLRSLDNFAEGKEAGTNKKQLKITAWKVEI
jgi:hypothetical protein